MFCAVTGTMISGLGDRCWDVPGLSWPWSIANGSTIHRLPPVSDKAPNRCGSTRLSSFEDALRLVPSVCMFDTCPAQSCWECPRHQVGRDVVQGGATVGSLSGTRGFEAPGAV